ncbi:cytochrome c oxidase subunit 2 (mitochondrion) [Paramicrosporidium saccamoebae]|uniref:Cytochrome c oxidase subunit 2 n=1 Tax=Paramicrosporidium saccamoebae TaxID=1246581 RepID=A0A2H9TR24_9FUNG|nr:cytochrome c oxidase subunit 2 [Paramicrosporidium saccamoebae]
MIKIYNDSPSTWQLSFQDEATPIAAGIIDFHNKAMYYLIIVFSLVSYFIIARIFSNRSINWFRVINHSTTIELIWTITPGIILVLIALPSLKLLYALDDIVKPNVTLKATGSQWFWTYEINDIEGLEVNFDSYTKTEDDLEFGELRLLDVDNRVLLPIHTPIRLLVTGQDVIHSFFVPSLGVKMDAVPGRINHSSIFLLRPGVFYGQCAELCGSNHERMSIVVEGVDNKSYLSWLATFA